MATLVLDPHAEAELRSWRGDDRYDEVWEGVTVMSPLPNLEHQDFLGLLHTALSGAVRAGCGGKVYPGCNVSDRSESWRQNYRCPDVAVYLKGNPAVAHFAHYEGGPDLAVEVVSPGEDPLAKLDFYALVGTRELLVVNRDPWSLEMFVLADGELGLVDGIEPGGLAVLSSAALGVTFRFVPGADRPGVEVTQTASGSVWSV